MASDCGDLDIFDHFQWVTGSGILSDGGVEIVDFFCGWVKDNVFQESTEFHGMINFGFFFFCEADAFGVAAAFHVEDALVSPDVFVITDEFPVSNCTESGFASSRESKEDADVTVFPNIAAGMHGKMALFGHEVVHDGEDTLFHFSSILCSQNNEFSRGKVESNTSFDPNIWNEFVCREFTCIKNVVVSAVGKVFIEFLGGGPDEHVGHEQGMVRSCADDSDSDSFGLVPACVAVDYVQAFAAVQVVAGNFVKELEGGLADRHVHFSPADFLFSD